MASPAAVTDTRTMTVRRGGREFQTVVLEEEIAPDGRPMRAGSLIVKFRPGAAEAGKREAHQQASAQAVEALALADTQRVQVQRGQVAPALAAYRARVDVMYAEPDYIARASVTRTRQEAAFKPTAQDDATVLLTPNDPRLRDQWGLPKIGASTAWDRTRGSATTLVAVLDCGIYSSSSTFVGPDGQRGHADVRSKVALERNFTTSPNGADDFCDHGTHVAGIAAASTNNGIGVAGVGFDVRVINGKVLGDDGNGSSAWIASGITWAADNGAKVINMSLGSDNACPTVYRDAVNYAWARGAVVIAAAGNDSVAHSGTPGNCPNVLSVAATDQNDARGSFSNFGTDVDIAAPGVGILSANFDGNYALKSGTSMATPMVAGLAALLWSTGYGANNQAIVNRITSTANRIAGTGNLWTHGRINADAATATLDCTANSRVSVSTAANGSGRVASTITANGTTNTLQALQFTRLANARVLIAGQPTITAPTTITLPGVTSQTVVVERVGAGAATAEVTVTDRCGTWQTFVGLGQSVP
jgi:thermitase